jgi:hypothetical protein
VTRHLRLVRDRQLCPLGCVDGYVGDADGEPVPCPHCQATRLAAVDRARSHLAPAPPVDPAPTIADLTPAARAARLAERAWRRTRSTNRGDPA